MQETPGNFSTFSFVFYLHHLSIFKVSLIQQVLDTIQLLNTLKTKYCYRQEILSKKINKKMKGFFYFLFC